VAAGKSAKVGGEAAAMGENNKEEEVRRDIDGGAYEWEPVAHHRVMESAGRLGKSAMPVINRLAKIAAESDGVEKHVFVWRVQRR
jgi:hypothetical protein